MNVRRIFRGPIFWILLAVILVLVAAQVAGQAGGGEAGQAQVAGQRGHGQVHGVVGGHPGLLPVGTGSV